MITEYAHLTGICVTKDHMDIYNLGRSPQLMLAFIIITPKTLGYKSALKTARKVHQYLVPTYLSKITSNTLVRAKNL